MYLDQHFGDFLKDAVNPERDGVTRAKAAHQNVRAYLQSKEGLGERFKDSFLAGSYARDTSINPIKDVDIPILTTYTDADDPVTVLRELRKVLKRNYDKTEDDTANQRRSIRVELADEGLTMDIIPAYAPSGSNAAIKIPDRVVKGWIDTHPRAHVALSEERNGASSEISGQHIYKPTVKLLRWWKHHQLPKQRHPKGFLVEIMAYECASTTAAHWAEALKGTMDAIAAKYGRYRGAANAPVFNDPALVGKTIGTGLTGGEFTTFLDKLDEGRDLLARAIKAEEADESAELYCKLFVDGFPCPKSGKRAPALVGSERRVTEPRRFA